MKARYAIVVLALAFIVLSFADITAFIDGSRQGIMLFGTAVLPVLFPFFFISGLIIQSGIFNRKSSALSVFLVGVLSGYPTTAKMLGELYERGDITRNQAIKISTYTSMPSPVFIIATVGTGLYVDTKLGVLMFVAILAGMLLNGFIYRKTNFQNEKVSVEATISAETQPSVAEMVSTSLFSAIQGILAVGGMIVIFFIAVNQVDAVFSLGSVGQVLLASTLEMTNGVFLATGMNPLIAVGILAFGGLCVALQGMIFFKSFKMPIWFYLLYKMTHTLLSVGIFLIMSMIVLP